jgi:hypothetical protein
VLGLGKLQRLEACGEAVDRTGEQLIVGEIGEHAGGGREGGMSSADGLRRIGDNIIIRQRRDLQRNGDTAIGPRDENHSARLRGHADDGPRV